MFQDLAVDIIPDILCVLVEEKCMTLQEINIRTDIFKYSHRDKAKKPQPIRIISGSNVLLKETCEMWN